MHSVVKSNCLVCGGKYYQEEIFPIRKDPEALMNHFIEKHKEKIEELMK